MTQNVVKFLVRRGSDQDRKSTTLELGELAFVETPVDARRLFIGTGNLGGVPAGSKFFYIPSFASGAATLSYVQPNDIVYDISTSKLMALTGVNPLVAASYLIISQS